MPDNLPPFSRGALKRSARNPRGFWWAAGSILFCIAMTVGLLKALGIIPDF